MFVIVVKGKHFGDFSSREIAHDLLLQKGWTYLKQYELYSKLIGIAEIFAAIMENTNEVLPVEEMP